MGINTAAETALITMIPTPRLEPTPANQSSTHLNLPPITTANVAQFARPEHLSAEDVRLMIELAGIALDAETGEGVVMRCLGLAATNPPEIRHTLDANRLGMTEEPPLGLLVVRGLEAAQKVHDTELERRFDAAPAARANLLAFPRYRQLLRDNNLAVRAASFTPLSQRMPPGYEEVPVGKALAAQDLAYRKLQYYTIGRVAGMIASTGRITPVQ